MNKKLLMAGLLVTLLAGCGDVFAPASKEVCITGYNQYERQFHKFRLDAENKSGCSGSPSGREGYGVYGGGGGFVCGCRVTPGKQVNLYWSFEPTLEAFRKGSPLEEYTVVVTIPQPESSSSRYLRIYFMKSGIPQLQWVDDLRTPKIMPSSENEVQ